MATLIPAYSSCAPRMTSGERRFAQRLREKLGDDTLIWYDIPVGPRGLHPDFILLHPAQGLTVLEVKDWKLNTIVRVDPDTFQILTHDGPKQVKHPLRQARDYAFAICTLLEQDSALTCSQGRYQGRLVCPYAYGVVLPNITRRQFDSEHGLSQVIEPHQVICRDEMTEGVAAEALQAQLRDMRHYAFGSPLKSVQIDRIRWHLYPDLRLASSPTAPLEAAPEAEAPPAPDLMRIMSLQQEQLARSLGSGHRVIHGVAGSGKTMILLHRCQYLAETGQSVLVLCFNAVLAARLRSHLTTGLGSSAASKENPRVTVYHFHRWCIELLDRHHIPRPNSRQYKGDAFISQLEATVLAAVHKGQIPKGQYDAVLVDEGHDFKPQWLQLIAQMVSPQTQALLLLYDDAQNLYGAQRPTFSFRSVGIQAQGRTTIFKLNYRNTVQVLTLAYEFAKEVIPPTDTSDEDSPPIVEPSSAGRSGPHPELIRCTSFAQEVAAIAERAQQLHTQGIPWQDMAIIYRNRWMGERMETGLQQAKLPVDWISADAQSRHFNAAAPSLKLLTMHASKGLEFPVVFIPGLGYLPHRHGTPAEEARLLYVAMTRALDVLVLSGHRDSAFVQQLAAALERVRA